MSDRCVLRFCAALIVVLAGGLDRTAAARPAEIPIQEPADGASIPPARWAILGSPPVLESGLADLVTARLAGLEGIELLEREDFDAIAREYQLSRMQAADSVQGRVELGRILRADHLLLLSREEAPLDPERTIPVIKLVIADCRTGARIGHESFPAEGEVAAQVDSVVAAVRETRARYPAGVERIVAVSHFLSRNLLRTYHSMQAGLACLLQRGLAAHPAYRVFPGNFAVSRKKSRRSSRFASRWPRAETALRYSVSLGWLTK